MSTTFRAFQVTRKDGHCTAKLGRFNERDLMPGDVTVKVEYSGLNYKDGLALTKGAPVIRRFPLIPGIDLAGTVTASDNSGFKAGDKVLLTGFGTGETHHGGFSERARVDGARLLPLPKGMSTRQAMVVGTAGFTAMLCVTALEKHGIHPGDGDIVVTGAAGGVGSIALAILARLGYRVVAVTGRTREQAFLRDRGASEIIDRHAFSEKARPLAPERWVGAIDVAGGHTLANVLSQLRYGGAAAACGLAESIELPAFVAPFILRGITLYGIDSVMVPLDRRPAIWDRIVRDLDLVEMERRAEEISLEDLPAAAEAILAGQIRGRTIVKIQ